MTKESFPNPKTNTELRERLNKLWKQKDFCKCDNAFWVDGFCWECKKPCNPEEVKAEAEASYLRKRKRWKNELH